MEISWSNFALSVCYEYDLYLSFTPILGMVFFISGILPRFLEHGVAGKGFILMILYLFVLLIISRLLVWWLESTILLLNLLSKIAKIVITPSIVLTEFLSLGRECPSRWYWDVLFLNYLFISLVLVSLLLCYSSNK